MGVRKLPMPFNNPRTYDGHSGVDFAQDRGTPIPASGPGVVGRVWHNDAGGWWTTIEYDDNTRVGYAHQDKKPKIKVGTRVRAGDTIGHVGSKGRRSTGPHLHLEISHEGTYAAVWKWFDRTSWIGKTNTFPTVPENNDKKDEDEEMIVNLEGIEGERSGGAYITKDGKSYFMGPAAQGAPTLGIASGGSFLAIYPRAN